MDIIVLIIKNSHRNREDGNRAVGRFEARIASIPAFNEGFRLFLQFPAGYTRCPIFNGRDRFCLIVIFVAAISFDDSIIPVAALRGTVLDACEKAAYLAHLLRAEAVPTARSVELYEEARGFLEVLRSAEFVRRQPSEFAIPKFRMLMYVINRVVKDKRAAPACSDSGVFESALRFLVSKVAHDASGNRDLLRDIADRDDSRMALDLLRSKKDVSDVAASIAAASSCPVRLDLMERCRRTRAVFEVPLKAQPAGDSDVAQAVRAAWERVPGNTSGVSGASVDWTRARYFEECHVHRTEERFAAPVHLRQTVLVDGATWAPPAAAAPPRRAGVAAAAAAAAAAADAVDPGDRPETAALARVVAFFYLPPPAEGSPSDGIAAVRVASAAPVAAPSAGGGAAGAAAGSRGAAAFGGGAAAAAQGGSPVGTAQAFVGRQNVQEERMFAVLHPFRAQTAADKTRLVTAAGRPPGTHRFLRHYAIRCPAEAAPGQCPYVVLPVSAIRRAVRVLPPKWPDGRVPREELIRAAKCETGPALVFWEPRDLWLPTRAIRAEEE
jgi:hypothetical protein